MEPPMTRKEFERIYKQPIENVSKEVAWQVWSWKRTLSESTLQEQRDQVQNVTEVQHLELHKLLEFWLAAEHFNVPDLLTRILSVFQRFECFGYTAALDYYKRAVKLRCTKIADVMLARVGQAFLSLIYTPEYYALDIETVCAVLDSEYLAVNTELEVFYAASLWILVNVPERYGHLTRLYKVLRLQHLQPIMPETVRQLSFFLPHAIEPRTRSYILDPRCNYYNLIVEGRVNELSFGMFLDYIRFLVRNPKNFMQRVNGQNEDNNNDD